MMPRPPRGGSILSSALRHWPRCSSGPQGLGGAPRALGRQPSARGEGGRENPGVQSPWPLTAQTGVTFVSGPQTSKRTSGGEKKKELVVSKDQGLRVPQTATPEKQRGDGDCEDLAQKPHSPAIPRSCHCLSPVTESLNIPPACWASMLFPVAEHCSPPPLGSPL